MNIHEQKYWNVNNHYYIKSTLSDSFLNMAKKIIVYQTITIKSITGGGVSFILIYRFHSWSQQYKRCELWFKWRGRESTKKKKKKKWLDEWVGNETISGNQGWLEHLTCSTILGLLSGTSIMKLIPLYNTNL